MELDTEDHTGLNGVDQHVHDRKTMSGADNAQSPNSESSSPSDHDQTMASELAHDSMESINAANSHAPQSREAILASIENLPAKPTKAMKSLIDLQPVRVPELREGKRQDLAIRPVNHEAALAQSRGNEVAAPCDHCNRQRGIWIGCVVVPGYFRGACANCHYMGQGTRCSLRPDADECRRRRNFYADPSKASSSPLSGPYVNTFGRQPQHPVGSTPLTPLKRGNEQTGTPSSQLGVPGSNIAPKRARTGDAAAVEMANLGDIFTATYADAAARFQQSQAPAANGHRQSTSAASPSGSTGPAPAPLQRENSFPNYENLPPLDRRKVAGLVRSLVGTTKTLSDMAAYLAELAPENRVLLKASETVVEMVGLLSQEMER